ncbi:hypothetical protein JQX08_12075 [Pseudomonas sp. UL073]|uniref:Uncharacterized protein n=1 Tax=Zestomonas insulae TaxID=2809017 RepID=A0ABS2IHW9_9GAMM|nr:hypothetical protein [Pseudomonas insulae]MBM7061443.1 hypothetical protein [Pseudomonas insulae]
MRAFLHANWPWLILLALGAALLFAEHGVGFSLVRPLSGTGIGRSALSADSTRLIGGVLLGLALWQLLRRR